MRRHTRLMQSAARKLERHRTLLALTMVEYRTARDLVRAAVAHVNEYCERRPRASTLPRVFLWHGARYSLEYSTLGRITVRVSGSAARFSSAVGVL